MTCILRLYVKKKHGRGKREFDNTFKQIPRNFKKMFCAFFTLIKFGFDKEKQKFSTVHK